MAQHNFTITHPQAFWAAGSSPPVKWSEWKDYFLNYIGAIDMENKMPAEQKKRLLLHMLGPVGLKTYNKMQKSSVSGDGCVFNAAMQGLDKYFAPKVCVGITRYKFFQRKQQKGESADDYVADLKKLALDCKFGSIHDDLIRDQVVVHSNNQSIQERLWINGDSPLEEIVAIVRKAEISERCVSELRATEKSVDSVYKVINHSTLKEQRSSQGNGSERRCYRCDSKEHLAYAKTCPAVKQKCSKCDIVGHFAKVCRNKKKLVKCIVESSVHAGSGNEEYTCESREVVEDVNFILNIINAETKGKPMCDMEIGGIPITIETIEENGLRASGTKSVQALKKSAAIHAALTKHMLALAWVLDLSGLFFVIYKKKK
ncbi:hypothetical protein NDU88_006868 [Pleurodeles waltl]|uniref:CCHC-type domain-containing protein n=1 Tax=Pleurodeles waltl TaxID=8319 RepID=A0AAV7WF77_PLEWA|nr:hypothetical protein NDU88_006868 [Pleurodeles waltl]